MKKNILVYTYNLDIGGIERSLIGLLDSIDYKKYEVDLYMFKHEGILMKDIPKEVNILKEDPISRYAGIPIIEVFKKKGYYIGVMRLYAKFKSLVKERILKQSVSGEYMSQITYPKFCSKMKKIDKHYDLAISFYWPHYFIRNNVVADKKIGWIHTDYEQIYPNHDREVDMWNGIDYVAAVSEDCKKSFLNKYPQLKEKTIVIENILPENYVNQMSNKEIINDLDRNSYILCSIGRFCYAKNFDNVPNICKRIRDKGIDVKWYIIGYGPDEQKIKDEIRKENMDDYVILLGKKENPYPYIKACDIYVQPSRFEGKSVTVREAQMLSKPVVITNYSTASSQVKNGYDGIIVDMDNESIAQGIYDLLKDKEKKEYLINYCKRQDFSNKEEINKIESIMIG